MTELSIGIPPRRVSRNLLRLIRGELRHLYGGAVSFLQYLLINLLVFSIYGSLLGLEITAVPRNPGSDL